MNINQYRECAQLRVSAKDGKFYTNARYESKIIVYERFAVVYADFIVIIFADGRRDIVAEDTYYRVSNVLMPDRNLWLHVRDIDIKQLISLFRKIYTNVYFLMI